MSGLHLNPEELIEGDIFTMLGLEHLPDEQKEGMFKKMIEILESRTLIRLADAVPGDKQEEWQKLLEAGDQPALQAFLQLNNIDLAALITQEALLLKTEMVHLGDAAQG